MNSTHLHILQHALGVDQYGCNPHRPNSDDEFGCYRNRFITSPTCPDGLLCQELATLGHMHDHGPQRLAGGMHYYTVTQAGYDAMRAASPAPPKVSRSKARYARYRSMSDLFDSFKDFLGYEADERQARKLGFSDVYAYYDWSKNAARRDMGFAQ